MINKINTAKSGMLSEAGKVTFEKHYLIQMADLILSPS